MNIKDIIGDAETKSITFSDSIVIFSKMDTEEDAIKILIDCGTLMFLAIINEIAIKGALSFGEVTVDFDKNLFFGRPIIDAYLLHEQLQLYATVLDHNFEEKLKDFKSNNHSALFTTYKTPLKTGKVIHKLVTPKLVIAKINIANFAENFYHKVSGAPRIYVDNTVEFLRSLLPKDVEKK